MVAPLDRPRRRPVPGSRCSPATGRALLAAALLALGGCAGSTQPGGPGSGVPAPTRAEPASAPVAPRPLPVLYTDLDGTLLDEHSSIPPANLTALQRYRQSGGKVGVATGRLPESALPFARAIGADVPLVFANGAVVTDPSGQLVEMRGLTDVEQIRAVCADLTSSGCAHVYAAFGDPNTGEVEVLDGRCEPPPRSDQVVLKMRARRCQDHDELVERLTAAAASRFSVVVSGQGEYFGVAVAAVGVSKGQALRSIAARLGIGLDELAFIGDSGNDVSAARAVRQAGGTCFAMTNGTADLHAACPRHTSRDNAHGGVAEAVDELLAGASPR